MFEQRGRRGATLWTPFLFLLGVAAVGAGGLLWHASQVSEAAHREAALRAREAQQTLGLLERFRHALHRQAALLHDHVADPRASAHSAFHALHVEAAEAGLGHAHFAGSDAELELVTRLRQRHADLGVIGQVILEEASAGRTAAALRELAAAEELHGVVAEELERLAALRAAWVAEVLEQAADQGTPLSRHLVILFALLAVALVAFGVMARWRIHRPLARLLAVVQSLRDGHLEARARTDRDDELGVLAEGFNQMAETVQAGHEKLEQRVRERTAQVEELQVQLVQSAKMAAVGQLVSGVAHELNNPLTVITGMSELGREDAGKAPRTELAQSFAEIEHHAERCRRIVEDLLQFARPGAATREPVALDGVVERTLKLRRAESRPEEVEFHFRPGGDSVVVQADPYKLQQVVLTLLNNAVDAIAETGRKGTVELSTSRSGTEAVLEVRDDGAGLRDVSRVFEPFYTTKDVGKGTGLGLSVCYGIVQAHEGRIRAEALARGTRFVVNLPLAEGEVVEGSPGPDEADGSVLSPGLRVLLVDDEPAVLRVQVAVLERLGLQARCAHSAEQALELVAEGDFDAVVSDLRMPGGMDGRELHARLRECNPALAGRFLLTSGDAGEPVARSASEPAVLQKPFRAQQLGEALQRVLGLEVTR